MVLPRGMTQRNALDASIQEVIADLGPEVLRVRYTLDDDWSGDPAIFFRILLVDRAMKKHNMFDVTQRIKRQIRDRLEPTEQWGLLPYFSFRTKSEQDEMQEKVWA